MVYLQKAPLKAAGLLSREKTMIISGKNHLRCKWYSEDQKSKDRVVGDGVKKKRREDMEQVEMRGRGEKEI